MSARRAACLLLSACLALGTALPEAGAEALSGAERRTDDPMVLVKGEPTRGAGYRWDGRSLTLENLARSAGGEAALTLSGFDGGETVWITLSGENSLAGAESLLAPCGLLVRGEGSLRLEGDAGAGGLLLEGAELELGGTLRVSGDVVNAGTLSGTGTLALKAGAVLLNAHGHACTAETEGAQASPGKPLNVAWEGEETAPGVREGPGWRWDGGSRQLTLSDGFVRAAEGGNALEVPAGAAVRVTGHVVLSASGGDGPADALVLSGGAALTLEQGARLTVYATGCAVAGDGSADFAAGGRAALMGAQAGLALSGDVSIGEGAAVCAVSPEGDGLRCGSLRVEQGGSLAAWAGEDGASTSGLLEVAGTAHVAAGGRGLISTAGSVRVSGAVSADAGGDAVHAARLATLTGASRPVLQGGGAGIWAGENLTLNSDPAFPASVTGGGDAVVAGGTAVLADPGDLTLTAGEIGVAAGSGVEVGGGGADSRVAISCGSYSIRSEAGGVSIGSCRDMYFFDGGIYTDVGGRKTVDVRDGAAVFYGIRAGFGVGIVRKDLTLTGEETGDLLNLVALQVGKGYTLTLAGDASLKTGPIVAGASSSVVAEPGSRVYYNGLAADVEGETVPFLADTLDLTSPEAPAGLARLGENMSWSGETLTLSGAVVDVRDAAALVLPAGSTVAFGGECSYLSAGVGAQAVISSPGALTLSGGAAVLSGGRSGVSAGGGLRVEDTDLKVYGTQEAALLAEGDLVLTGGSLEVFTGSGDGVSASGELLLADARVKIRAPGTALSVGGGLSAEQSGLELHGGTRAVEAGSGISIDGLPEDVQAADGTLVRGGVPLADLTAVSAPAEADTAVTVSNDDGSVTTTATDGATGLVTSITTAANGTVTATVARADGASAVVTQEADGTTAVVTLPQGVDRAGLTLPVPEAGPCTVPVLADGGVLVKSVSGNAEVSLLADGATGPIRFEDRGAAFEDVPEDAWYAGAVDFVAGRGLFLGTSEGVFSPEQDMTQGMLLTVLYRLEGAPDVAGAQDAWYGAGVAWAGQVGLVLETDGWFDPRSPVSRQALALLFSRYGAGQGLDVSARSGLIRFPDGGAVSSWAADAVGWAVHAGVLQGTGGALNPGGSASRCEVAAMLERFTALLCTL